MGGLFRVRGPVVTNLCALFPIAKNHLEAIQRLKWVIKWYKNTKTYNVTKLICRWNPKAIVK